MGSDIRRRRADVDVYVGYMVLFFIVITLLGLAMVGGLLVVLASVNGGPPPGG